MATHQETQKLFRQQIAIARQLKSIVDDAKTRPAQLAATQGCLLALELGFLAYCRAVFDAPEILKLQDCEAYAGDADYRQREILNLLKEGDSWLTALTKIFASLKHLPKPREPAQASQVIATSAAVCDIHWTQIDQMSLEALLDDSDALQKRHSDSDEEY